MSEPLTAAAITAGLRSIGLVNGQTVLVHTSLSSMGRVEGGANTVIDALLAAVGPDGTIIVPTLTGSEQDSPECPPVFDPSTTSCWTGIIPETLRQRPTALRSHHPTHSVAAIGPKAATLTADHVRSVTPCDALSPYGKLAHRDEGMILLLGVTHEANTTLHAAEEAAEADYHLQPEFTRCQLNIDGHTLYRDYRLHSWDTARHFEVMEALCLAKGFQRNGPIGSTTARLIRAQPMFAFAVEMLRAHPRFLCA